MLSKKPKYVVSMRGKFYFKRRGWPTQSLPDISDPSFEEAYNAAIRDWQNGAGIKGRIRLAPVDWVAFLKSRMEASRKRSVKQGVPFTICNGWLDSQLKEQGNRCAITGLKFRVDRDKHAPFAPSVDRIKGSLGYTPENCRIVCYIANCARNQFTDDDLLTMACGIVTEAERRDRNAGK